MKELILGGARSGKSQLAEQRALASGQQVVYIATAEVQTDAAFQQRIQSHRERRPSDWLTLEEPLALVDLLQQQADEQRCLLVDCLTLWVTNLLCHPEAPDLLQETNRLIDLIPQLPGQLILVSNEVSMGITPMGQLSRDFQDASGLLHQQLATVCDRVTLSVAGLPLTLKESLS